MCLNVALVCRQLMLQMLVRKSKISLKKKVHTKADAVEVKNSIGTSVVLYAIKI